MRIRHLLLCLLPTLALGGARLLAPSGLVRSVTLAGAVQGENITFEMQVAYEALVQGTNVCVLRGDVALLDAKLAKDVELVRDGDAVRLVPRPKLRAKAGDLTLTFAARTVADNDWRRARFAVPVLPVRSVTVAADRPDLEIRFPQGRDLHQAKDANGRTVTTAFLGLSPWLDIVWKPEIRRIDSELVATCEINTIATASPGTLRFDSIFSYRIAQGVLAELLFDLPDINVLDVAGKDIQDWRIDRTDPAVPRLRVTLGRPQTAQYAIQIAYERALPAFPCDVPLPVLVPRGVIRSGGTLALGTDSAVKLQVAAVTGLTQIDQAGFPRIAALRIDRPRTVPARSLFAYQYAALPYALKLTADQIVTAFTADIGLLVNVAEGQVQVDATVQLDVRDAPAREVRLLTDADARWTVTAVTGRQIVESDVDIRPGPGGRELVVPFRQPAEGTVVLNVRMEKPLGAARGQISVPTVRVVDARSQRGYIVAAAEHGIRLVPQETVELRDVHTASTPLRAEGAQLAYRFRQPDWKLTLGLEWAQSAIHSEIFHLVSLSEGVVYVSAAVNCHISGAPVPALRFHVPATIANLDVTGMGIDHWSRSNDVCTVQLATRAMGDFTLLMTYDQPLSYAAAVLPVGEIETLDTASEMGFIAVATAANLRVEEDGALPPALIRIPRDELPSEYAATVTAPVIAVYKYTRRPHAANLRVTPLETRRPIDQVVDYLALSTRIGRDGEAVTHAVYSVKNASRQYLAVRLPTGTTPWSVRQGTGDESRDLPAQQAADRLLIPVERPRDPNQAVTIEIVYAAAAPGAHARHVRLEAPTVLDAPVTFASWEVEADDNLAIGAAHGNLTPDRTQGWNLPCAQPWISAHRWRYYRTTHLPGEAPLNLAVTLVPQWLSGGSLTTLAAAGAAGLLALLVAVIRRRTFWFALALTLLAVAAAQTRPGVIAVGLAAAAVVPLALLTGLVRVAVRAMRARRAVDHSDPPPLQSVPFATPPVSTAPEAPPAPGTSGAAHPAVLLILAVSVLLGAAATRLAAETAPADQPQPQAAALQGPIDLGHVAPIPDALPDAAPLVVDRVDVAVRAPAPDPLTESTAAVTWKLAFRIDAPGRYALFPADTVLVAARLGSDRLRLQGGAAGVVLEALERGEYLAEFDCREPIVERGGEWSLQLPWPSVLVNRLVFDIPVADMEVRSEQAASITVQPAEGATHAEVAIGPARTVILTWRPRTRDTRAEAKVVYAEIATIARIRAGLVDVLAHVTYTVVQGESREFALRVPAGLSVTAVSAPSLATWSFDPATRRLDALIERPVSGPFVLQVGLQAPCGGLPFDMTLGALAAEGVERQRGRIALAAAEAVLLRVGETVGVTPIDSTDFHVPAAEAAPAPSPATKGRPPIEVEEPVRRAFRYDAPEAVQLSLHAEAVQSELRVTEASALTIGDERNMLSANIEIAVAKAGVFSVRLRLPEGYDIETLTGRDVSHWDDTHRTDTGVEIFFNRRVLDTTPVSLVLAHPQRGIPESVDVPRLAIEGAVRHTGRLAISAERGVKLTVARQEGVTARRPEGEKLAPGTLAFDLLRTDWTLTLQSQVLAPVLKSEVLHRVELAEGMLQHRVYLRYRIENAGVKLFRVRIPSADAPLAVSGRNIARVRPVDPAPGATGRVWEVELQGKVEDAYSLTCQYQEPYDAVAGTVVVEPFEVLGAARQSGYLVITGGGRVEVEPLGEPQGLKVEDARSLPDTFGAGDLSAAIRCYRTLQPDYRLPLSVVRHGVAEVLPASVEQVHLVSVLSGSGRLLTQATLTLKAGTLRFLRLALPSVESVLWAALVNGTEARVSRDGADLNIPLEGATGEQNTTVTLVFADRLAGETLAGRHLLRAPRFPDLPLRNIDWVLFVPRDYRCRFFDSDLDRVGPGPLGNLRSFEMADYESVNKKVQVESLTAARDNLRAVDQLLSSGRQMEARKAVQQAVNLSQAEQTLNEDARVQFRNVVQQQIKMGLVNRRGALRADNNIFDEAAPQTQGGFNEGNFSAAYIQQVEDQLAPQDRAALDLVAQKMVDQQANATAAGAAINIAMPQHGQEFRFQRALQNTRGAELRIAFRARRPLAVLPGLWRLWPVVPGCLGLWLLLRLACGPRVRR